MIELPMEILPQNMEDFFWAFLSEEITPILAHTERYPFLLQEPAILYDWIRMGILTQINPSSLVGRYGPKLERFAIQLMEHGMAHIIATDAHGMKIRRPKMTSGRKVAERVLGRIMARELVWGTPKRILEGRPVIPVEPVPFRSPSFLAQVHSFIFS
jgi:protein-tyrosine phosphatase